MDEIVAAKERTIVNFPYFSARPLKDLTYMGEFGYTPFDALFKTYVSFFFFTLGGQTHGFKC